MAPWSFFNRACIGCYVDARRFKQFAKINYQKLMWTLAEPKRADKIHCEDWVWAKTELLGTFDCFYICFEQFRQDLN